MLFLVKNMMRSFLLALSFIFPVKYGSGQRVSDFIDSDNGLVNNEVTSIIQDRKGFMWFGTRGGLHKFNGYEIKQIRNNKEEGDDLPSQSVEVLLNGKKNNLWIGTKSGGLASYNFLTARLVNYPNQHVSFKEFNSDYILSLYEDDNSRLYIGTWNGFQYLDENTNQFTILIAGCKTYDIRPDNQDGLWLATNRGLLHYNIKSNTSTALQFGYNQIDVTSICIDEDNTCLWLGTWRKGLIQYNYVSNQVTVHHIPSPESSLSGLNDTYRVFKDSRGIIWVGTWGGGLYWLVPGTQKFVNVPLEDSKTGRRDDKIILTIAEDESGLIWVGTDGAGIFKLDPTRKRFNNITYERSSLRSIDNNHILGLSLDKNGGLWVGTRGGGLQYSYDWKNFSKVIFNTVNPGPQTGLDIIKCVLEDGDYMWVGAVNGLSRINRNTVSEGSKLITLLPDESHTYLKGKKITALLKDTGDKLWVGTQEDFLLSITGYDEYNNPVIRSYSPRSDSLMSVFQNERVSCLFKDSKKRIWVGTYKGLYLYHRETDLFTGFFQTGERGLSNNTILSLAEDQNGNIWAGTQFGLNKITSVKGDRLTVTQYTSANGLPSEYIHSIQVDDRNRVWFGTNKGICLLDTGNQIHVFDKRDGVCSNMYSENASYRSADGKLFFGGFEGITYFSPDSIMINQFKPPLFFTGLKINNHLYEFGKEQASGKVLSRPFYETDAITLNYKQNFFSIDFASLDYHATDKNQYKYILEGFMDEWVNLGERRTISYTNLSPGSYTLRIQATNSDKIWNEPGISLKIRVLPPPWKTWWAYAIYFFVFAALLWYGRVLIQKQAYLKNKLLFEQKEREQENRVAEFKTNLFTNISHEFRTPLTLIIGPVEDLLRKAEITQPVKKSLRMIHKQSRRLLRMINQLLDFHRMEAGSLQLNAAQGEIVSFARDVFNMFTDEAIRKNMEYRFESSDKEIRLLFDRDKLEIILYNLLSNAFKFTPDRGKITMHVLKEKLVCNITVTDNGTGVSAGDLSNIFNRFYREKKMDETNISGTGIGLSFVKELVELHNGQISAESDGKSGSRFILKLPLNTDDGGPSSATRFMDSAQIESS